MSITSRGIAALSGLAGAGVALTIGLLAASGGSDAPQPGAPGNAPAPDCAGKHEAAAGTGGVHNAAFVKVAEEPLTVGALLASGSANTC